MIPPRRFPRTRSSRSGCTYFLDNHLSDPPVMAPSARSLVAVAVLTLLNGILNAGIPQEQVLRQKRFIIEYSDEASVQSNAAVVSPPTSGFLFVYLTISH